MRSLNFPSVLLDENLNVCERLQEMRVWYDNWIEEDSRVEGRIFELDIDNNYDNQLATQMQKYRDRLAILKVRCPIEIDYDIVAKIGTGYLEKALRQQYSILTATQQHEWMNNFLFIIFPMHRTVLNAVNEMFALEQLGQQRNMFLSGNSGAGKTTLTDYIVVSNPPHITRDRNIVTAGKILAPPAISQSPIMFYQRILQECGASYVKSAGIKDLNPRLVHAMVVVRMVLLVIDEIKNISRHDLQRCVMDISNQVPQVRIIATSVDAVSWASTDLEIQGRWKIRRELPTLDLDELCQLLASLDLLLPFPKASWLGLKDFKEGKSGKTTDPGPARLLHTWTGGIVGDVMEIVRKAAKSAIEQKLPNIPLNLLMDTWGNWRKS